MRRKIWNYFKVAAEAACRKDDERNHNLGALGIRSDGVVVTSCNGPCPIPNREMHAEYKLSKMLDYNAIVYVVRVTHSGQFGMAMPCKNCIKVLKSKRVRKVYFTVGPKEFGVLYL